MGTWGKASLGPRFTLGPGGGNRIDPSAPTHKYADVRTSIELPDDLLRRAKITAVERGTTLRVLVEQALRRELGLASRENGGQRRRAEFPVFTSVAPGSMELGATTLRELEVSEDLRRHGTTGR